MESVWYKLKLVKQGLKKLNNKEFAGVTNKVRECKEKLEILQRQIRSIYEHQRLFEEEKELKAELSEFTAKIKLIINNSRKIEPFLLAVGDLDAVFSTEVDIAGAKSRMTSASLLKSAWVNASREMNMKALDLKVADSEVQSLQTAGIVESQSILLAEGSLLACMRAGFNILNERTGEQPGIIIVTGSLHIVSAVLGYFHS
ncbi:hypothetical protein RND71_023062 [Anisodus tanguticus]|uniref:Uncharacterized protein n=1 Tax=Anisodus tanguticus TaxID=243964 RepID=A0AAE1RUU1_9SOLA|nr:hypothetical protein RND71_023062 [Anisodus tanguticus]